MRFTTGRVNSSSEESDKRAHTQKPKPLKKSQCSEVRKRAVETMGQT